MATKKLHFHIVINSRTHYQENESTEKFLWKILIIRGVRSCPNLEVLNLLVHVSEYYCPQLKRVEAIDLVIDWLIYVLRPQLDNKILILTEIELPVVSVLMFIMLNACFIKSYFKF